MKKSIKSPKRTKKSKQSTSRQKTKEPDTTKHVTQKAVRQALIKVECLETPEYDGILGKLPDWIPEPERRRFIATRIVLIEEYSPKEIRRLMISRERIYQGGFSFVPDLPPEYEDKIDTLNDIKRLVGLGEEEGLKRILGEERFKHHARGKKILDAAKQGHVATHGTQQEKNQRWKNMQTEIDKLYSKKPHLSYANLCKNVADKLNVSPKTIQRHAVNPHKK